ncbi:MAG: hydroxyectoine utilization dehydratase EutB [Pseudomonadota bacterium]
MPIVDYSEIIEARQNIGNAILKTPMVLSQNLSDKTGCEIFLKLEHHQKTGSFKLRGASNAVACLTEEQKRVGVVGVSTGNHGRGLARACRQAGIRCVICMSDLVPQNKLDGIRAEGAEILISGSSQDEAEKAATQLEKEGMVMIPPFDHPQVIAGQGTLGLDVFEQLPELTTAVVPLSGGGLMSGVATALKHKNPDIHIVGVSMQRGAAMYACIQAGKYVEVEELPTLADSLGGGIGEHNTYTFEMVQKLVDEYILVSETDIAEAIRHAYWQERQILEGSGSVALAAILSGKLKPADKTVLFCCGGNIDMSLHHRIVSGENVDLMEAKR